jgi:hypothetical protein
MSEVYETQEIFFKKLTRNKLNELLNRISSNYLKNQLSSILFEYNINTTISKNCQNIYINFFKNNEQIGHISFHLSKNNKNMKNNALRKGRLHATNNKNKNRYFPIRVDIMSNTMTMTINSPLVMSNDLSICVNTTLNIINDYLNPQSNLYLKYKLTQYGDKEHKCLNSIAGPIEKSRFNYTRSKSKSISIPISKYPTYSWGK